MKRKKLRRSQQSTEKVLKRGKLKKEEEEEDGSDEEEDEEIQLEGSSGKHESIPVTFEFTDMKAGEEDYIQSIRMLLRRSLFANPSTALSASESIARQTAVGTAVVCEGERDVFAFASVLPIAALSEVLYIHSIAPIHMMISL